MQEERDLNSKLLKAVENRIDGLEKSIGGRILLLGLYYFALGF